MKIKEFLLSNGFDQIQILKLKFDNFFDPHFITSVHLIDDDFKSFLSLNYEMPVGLVSYDETINYSHLITEIISIAKENQFYENLKK